MSISCDICFRTGGHKLPFLCPTDARNQLYESRIQNARVLLEKDALDREIAALTQHSNEQKDIGTSAHRSEVDDIIIKRDQTVDRTEQIIAHADELRDKINQAKEDIERRKASLTRRKSELASATNGVGSRRARQSDEVEKSIRMTRYKWNQTNSVTATSRTFLCSETAKLYGLRRARRNGALEDYRIGGIGIVDLRSMNTASAAQISTGLSHIVHLLMLTTHYLSIRLPAEITLPHRDYPLPTIFPLQHSYKHTNVPFPGGTPGHSSNTSPTVSRHADNLNQPRPRPLWITKPLPILGVEDQVAHSLFLEGVTLLAYNIAWLCKSQGIPVGENSSFEDVCNIGRNMYNLLLGPFPRPSPSSRVPSSQITPTKNGDLSKNDEDKRNMQSHIMGRYSHGTAHSFLGSAEGTEFIRSWKIPSPIKMADRLKSQLMSEVANSEWEVLDQDAWAIDDEMGDDGVVVGARKEGSKNTAAMLGMQSFMSMRTVIDAVEMVGDGTADRKPGTSGWTKLKPR